MVNWGGLSGLTQSQHTLGSSFWLMMSEEEPGQVQVMSEEEPGQVQVMSEEATPGWVKVQGRF